LLKFDKSSKFWILTKRKTLRIIVNEAALLKIYTCFFSSGLFASFLDFHSNLLWANEVLYHSFHAHAFLVPHWLCLTHSLDGFHEVAFADTIQKRNRFASNIISELKDSSIALETILKSRILVESRIALSPTSSMHST